MKYKVYLLKLVLTLMSVLVTCNVQANECLVGVAKQREVAKAKKRLKLVSKAILKLELPEGGQLKMQAIRNQWTDLKDQAGFDYKYSEFMLDFQLTSGNFKKYVSEFFSDADLLSSMTVSKKHLTTLLSYFQMIGVKIHKFDDLTKYPQELKYALEYAGFESKTLSNGIVALLKNKFPSEEIGQITSPSVAKLIKNTDSLGEVEKAFITAKMLGEISLPNFNIKTLESNWDLIQKQLPFTYSFSQFKNIVRKQFGGIGQVKLRFSLIGTQEAYDLDAVIKEIPKIIRQKKIGSKTKISRLDIEWAWLDIKSDLSVPIGYNTYIKYINDHFDGHNGFLKKFFPKVIRQNTKTFSREQIFAIFDDLVDQGAQIELLVHLKKYPEQFRLAQKRAGIQKPISTELFINKHLHDSFDSFGEVLVRDGKIYTASGKLHSKYFEFIKDELLKQFASQGLPVKGQFLRNSLLGNATLNRYFTNLSRPDMKRAVFSKLFGEGMADHFQTNIMNRELLLDYFEKQIKDSAWDFSQHSIRENNQFAREALVMVYGRKISRDWEIYTLVEYSKRDKNFHLDDFDIPEDSQRNALNRLENLKRRKVDNNEDMSHAMVENDVKVLRNEDGSLEYEHIDKNSNPEDMFENESLVQSIIDAIDLPSHTTTKVIQAIIDEGHFSPADIIKYCDDPEIDQKFILQLFAKLQNQPEVLEYLMP